VTPNPEANNSPTTSRALHDWVKEVALLTRPDAVVWCDGSEVERDRLTKEAVAAGILIPLNREKRPGCYLHRSNPNDVARTEQLTFVCTPTREEAGPDFQIFFQILFRGSKYSMSYGSDPRKLFAVSVKATQPFSVAELLENLS